MANEHEEKKNSFIKERIVPKKKLKKVITTILCCLGLAVLFGLISAVSFSISRSLLLDDEETVKETIVIAQDDTKASTQATTATKAPTTTAATSSVASSTEESVTETLPEETIVSLKGIYEQVQNQLVWITGIYSKDGLVLDVQTPNYIQKVGFVVADSDTKWFVLTEMPNESFVEKYEGKNEGNQGELTYIGKDPLSNMGVFSALKSDFPDLQVSSLGNSFMMDIADSVYAICNHPQYGLTLNEGIISSVNLEIDDLDGYQTKFYTNMERISGEEGALFNEEGMLIGWISNYSCQGSERTSALGISPLKKVIERLCSNIAIPYLGLCCLSVKGEDVKLFGVEEGLYVQETKEDSPVYLAGIQPGDRIDRINNNVVKDGYSLQQRVNEMEVGDTIEIEFSRKNGEAYMEMKVQVTIGQR